MRKGLIYIHGKGGNIAEAEHYKPLFPEHAVIGFDYNADTPWDAQKEFCSFFDQFAEQHDCVIVIANSIGAFFALNSLAKKSIEKAFLISPIVDMEHLITKMMLWANVTESELRNRGAIETTFGETLSWEYLSWIRSNPIQWSIPTYILYGSSDNLQSEAVIRSFAERYNAELTIMEAGEHWFHTDEQMAFLDQWIINNN